MMQTGGRSGVFLFVFVALCSSLLTYVPILFSLFPLPTLFSLDSILFSCLPSFSLRLSISFLIPVSEPLATYILSMTAGGAPCHRAH